MKLLFIDESEKQQSKKKYFFALTALLVDKSSLVNTENELRELRIKCGFNNFNELKKVSKEKKIECTKAIFNILQKNNIQILAAVLGSVALRDIKKIENKYFESLTFLIERFYLHFRESS